MPLYEYQCDACGHRFEKIQKFSDPLETTCPKCGGVVHKLMSSPAIQFKGSGFYITDYAKKDYVSASKADGDSRKGEGQSAKGDKAESSPKSDKSSSSGEASPGSSSPAPAAPAKTSGD
ncbi:MAG TPA: zinc ribbon domain-containing protein [Vicinamibacterales bacterium]|jgi:putative FmdB family regulatory protein|nr:zinc ribbon domain-containing protein [Vicinamibacterales bacterium]